MRVRQTSLACVMLVLLASALACSPSKPFSSRIAMVRDYRKPLIVNIRWTSTLLQPTVQTISLATASQRNDGLVDGLWMVSDDTLYATRESESFDSSSDQFVRVYSNDGRMLAEYKEPPEDRFVTSPLIIEGSKSVVFITGSGRIMIGASPGYAFEALPQRLPLDLKYWPDSAKLYEIDGEHVVFGMEIFSMPVYRISLRDGSWQTIYKEAELLGTYQNMPIVCDYQENGTFHVQVLGGKFPKPGKLTWDGLGGYHTSMVNRFSPCGEYYLYDAAGLTGFRLKLAAIASPNAQVTLSSLGRVTSVGSWWTEGRTTTQPSPSSAR